MQVGMFLLFLRGIEVFETLCFVLRKKQNQVSFLHVYHHVAVYWLLWLTIKMSANDMEIFIMVLNLYVHVVMYFYYFLALFKKIQPYLRPIKPAITIMQMVSTKTSLNHEPLRRWYLIKLLLIFKGSIRFDVWTCDDSNDA